MNAADSLTKRVAQRTRLAARNDPNPGRWISEAEIAGLSERLENAQATLEAIQSSAVDGVLVKGASGSPVYSLTGIDHRFRIYVEQMKEGAITASHDGVILYCNRRFADMIKVPLERAIGDNIMTHLAPEVWTKIAALFDDDREFVKEETALQCSDRSELVVHITASRLPDQHEKIVCVVVTDLSEHKVQLELRLAKDLAEQSNRAKDRFLAALSHELRTPLTPVLMAAAALQKNELLPAHVHRELAMIRRNIELESRLIDDLLDHTSMTSGKIGAMSHRQNRGATLTAELPLRPQPKSDTSLVVAEPPAAEETRPLRILLVEDHQDTRTTLERFLQAVKNEVTAAATAAQALRTAVHQKFDLVVSDLGLPDDGGGLALMRRLRDEYGLSGIAISGYGMAQDVAESLAAGFAHHLTKPFNLDRLQTLIQAVSRQK